MASAAARLIGQSGFTKADTSPELQVSKQIYVVSIMRMHVFLIHHAVKHSRMAAFIAFLALLLHANAEVIRLRHDNREELPLDCSYT